MAGMRNLASSASVPAASALPVDTAQPIGQSATLVELGGEVIAVEPESAMLTELRPSLPTVRALGSAKAVPLPDASVDTVLATNAMHWFDMDVAGPETARFVVPDGILAGLWNVIDNRVDWVAGLERVSRSAAIGPREHSAADEPRRQTRTCQTLAWSPSSARGSTPSSPTGSTAPPTPAGNRCIVLRWLHRPAPSIQTGAGHRAGDQGQGWGDDLGVRTNILGVLSASGSFL
jgi:SAM-dependent methyltransferase